MKLKTVTLRSYKSIAKLEAFELRDLDVLIGASRATDYFNIGDLILSQSMNMRGK